METSLGHLGARRLVAAMFPKTKLTSNLVHINAVLLIQRERTIGDLCHRKPRLTLSRNISYSPRVGSIVYPGNPEFPIAT